MNNTFECYICKTEMKAVPEVNGNIRTGVNRDLCNGGGSEVHCSNCIGYVISQEVQVLIHNMGHEFEPYRAYFSNYLSENPSTLLNSTKFGEILEIMGSNTDESP